MTTLTQEADDEEFDDDEADEEVSADPFGLSVKQSENTVNTDNVYTRSNTPNESLLSKA